eukprot:12589389-Ditylum_brightwellii.AAC.1
MAYYKEPFWNYADMWLTKPVIVQPVCAEVEDGSEYKICGEDDYMGDPLGSDVEVDIDECGDE